jgi:hypothetical protein
MMNLYLFFPPKLDCDAEDRTSKIGMNSSLVTILPFIEHMHGNFDNLWIVSSSRHTEKELISANIDVVNLTALN